MICQKYNIINNKKQNGIEYIYIYCNATSFLYFDISSLHTMMLTINTDLYDNFDIEPKQLEYLN